MMSETSHEFVAQKPGYSTKFRRSTKESKEIANNYLVAKRMKKAMHNIEAKHSKIGNSETKNLIEATCSNLTTLVQLNFICENVTCDPHSEIPLIGGCCNNLENPTFGKFPQYRINPGK